MLYTKFGLNWLCGSGENISNKVTYFLYLRGLCDKCGWKLPSGFGKVDFLLKLYLNKVESSLLKNAYATYDWNWPCGTGN